MRIILLLICILILLILPVEIYDYSFVACLMIGGAITGVLFVATLKKYKPELKLNFMVPVFVVGFGILNMQSYKVRREGLFNQDGKTTSAIIVDRDTRHSKGKAIFDLHYRYKVNGKTYRNSDRVDFDVWFNMNLGPEIKIDYVEGRPSISRINKSSLIRDPNAHDKFMKMQKKL